jgi:hypothetical protein
VSATDIKNKYFWCQLLKTVVIKTVWIHTSIISTNQEPKNVSHGLCVFSHTCGPIFLSLSSPTHVEQQHHPWHRGSSFLNGTIPPSSMTSIFLGDGTCNTRDPWGHIEVPQWREAWADASSSKVARAPPRSRRQGLLQGGTTVGLDLGPLGLDLGSGVFLYF